MLSGTEAEIVNTVARLGEATKEQIRREIGLSSEYIDYLCRYLVKRGYLHFSNRRYSLSKMGIKSLLAGETTKIDSHTKDFGVGMIKKIATEVAEEFSDKLKKTVKDIKITVAQIGQKTDQIPEEKIKIKTDFIFPVEDESLALESNINKIGPNVEKEKSYIDEPVKLFKKLFKKFKKGGRDE